MVKKRFLLAVLLVLFLLLSSLEVLAGCCVGIIGCSRAFFDTECSELAAFDPSECEEIADCDVVACCHDIPGMSRAQYRSTCEGMAGEVSMTYIKPFVTNPASESAYASNLCEGALPPCTYVNCEQANPSECMCGSAVAGADAPYCCARDHSVFSSFGTCSQSLSCRVQDFYNVYGRVVTPDGVPIAGAEIRGPKDTITDDEGNFTLELIADDSRFTLRAIKNNTINITETLHISGADLHDVMIVLDIPEGPLGPVEDCTNARDDDGDQFFWELDEEVDCQADPEACIPDLCDTDCNQQFLASSLARPFLDKTVTEAYYDGVTELRCSDGFDNDCNGFTDCADDDCADDPYCQDTSCGDGTIQFPNSDGVYEQCDYYDPENPDEPIRNGTGDIIGNDSLCPGSCLPPGHPRECMCEYKAVCGNNIIDPPFEECEGVYDAARGRWTAEWNPASLCGQDECGTPDSIRPCQCLPEAVCGNGEVEPGEECDPNADEGGQCDADLCLPDCRCPPEEARCGNNLLEHGEDCDGFFDDELGEGGEWVEFKTRKYGCTPSKCALPVEEQACTCPTDCMVTPPGPVLDPVGVVQFEREHQLSWTDFCTGNVKEYNVLRCRSDSVEGCDPEGDDASYTVINQAPLGVQFEYDDTDFEGSTADGDVFYCYMIEGSYETESFSNEPVRSGHVCVKAGREECFDFRDYRPLAEEFCSDNVRSTCNALNEIVRVDEVVDTTDYVDCTEDPREGEPEHVCVGPYSPDHAVRPGLTQCVPKSICDYCNDPFGLFAYSSEDGTRWGYDPEGGLDYHGIGRAPDSEPFSQRAREQRYGFIPCFDVEMCYMDYSYTTEDMFYSYGEEPSCYDFNSLKACEKFNDTIGGGVCEWVWHPLYGELGVGVCRSSVIEEQECWHCHDPLNKVFGRCDRTSCSLYGHCYYDKADPEIGRETEEFADLVSAFVDGEKVSARADFVDGDYFQCRHEREITCVNYDSEADCIGSDSPYSVGGAEVVSSDVSVDVEGYLEGKDSFVKTSGSNLVTTTSDDFFGFGECQWAYKEGVEYEFDPDGERVLVEDSSWEEAEMKCFKNSDGSPAYVEVHGGPDSGYEIVHKHEISDCGGKFLDGDEASARKDILENIFDCRKDFSDPVTTLSGVYSEEGSPKRISGNFEIRAVVNDDSLDYSTYYPDTYATISDRGFVDDADEYYGYPMGAADKLGSEGNLITAENVHVNLTYDTDDYDFGGQGFREGVHYLTYFSEDLSHNIEEVKGVPVYIDPSAPVVHVDFSNVSYSTYEDVWFTNLTIDLWIEDEEDAFCEAKMFIGETHVYPLQDIFNEYGHEWVREYLAMHDDTYTFWYRCMDDVGNIAEDSITFVIEGDKSITNPRPRGTLDHTDVMISVETGLNAECRYLHSADDLPAFWDNRTFEESTFDTMVPFGITGSADEPSTVHRSDVTVGHGFHRYYVKCRNLNDGTIQGNAADQIRFAVDLEPPVTDHSANALPYNGWYNRPVDVFLSCGDPAIMGQGLDWSFGCNQTYYCSGLGCKDYEMGFSEYGEAVHLEETGYLTFYSDDKGGNQEGFVEDVLFQIDTEPPEISIDLYDGDVPAGVIVMNRAYKVVVSSSEPFISPAVSRPILSFTSSPPKFSGDIDLFPTEDPAVWEGIFFLENINANKGFEGEGIFTASGTDNHNVSGSGTMSIFIDTNPPDVPVLEPSLEEPSRTSSEYQSLGYPLNYHEGVYYTDRNSLFLTGYSGEFLDVIAVTSSEGVDEERIFTQTPAEVVYNDTVISGFEGYHEIKIFGDITGRVNSTLFTGLDEVKTTVGPMRAYGKYGMFYDITDTVYHAGDEQYTSVFIYPVIEETLALDRKILFYDQEYPSLWFGIDVPLTEFRNTTFYLKSYDSSENLIRYPEIRAEVPYLTFFSDPVPPSVIGHYPNDGSTSMDTFDVEVIVKEPVRQSGLFSGNVSFMINNDRFAYDVEHVLELEEQDPANSYYRIFRSFEDLDNGVYDVSIEGSDLAMNPFDESSYSSHWTFEVDRRVPADPYFSLVGGFQDPLTGSRWYADHSPDFILDFSDESNPVTIVDVFMDSAPTEGGAATCESTDFNVFRCVFTEPKTSSSQSGSFWADYGVVVKAFKTLADGTDSPQGAYGPFWFTVDDEAPDFDVLMNNRFRDNMKLSINAVVRNERHDLEARLDILGESYFPIYSSHNGTFYYFVWEVPDYQKSDEGPTSMRLTLTDFARNSDSKDLSVYLDLTPPNIQDVTMDISQTVEIGDELFTAQPEVTVSGDLVDDDIYKVWVSPGDYDPSTDTFAERKYAELELGAQGVPEAFTVTVNLFDPEAGTRAAEPFLYNYMLINQINNMTLFAMDVAGHVSHRPMRVISDLAPPLPPTFCVGEDGLVCVPPPSMPQ